MNFLQKKKLSEPIYAEPSKPGAQNAAASTSINSGTGAKRDSDETDNVTLRHNQPSSSSLSDDHTKNDRLNRRSESLIGTSSAAASTSELHSLDRQERIRHSDTQLLKDFSTNKGDENNSELERTNTVRRYHSKSLSLSENRIAASMVGSNLFQQNRDLWEKRAELQSQQCLTTPRILTRNRIAPDLVMDLPLAANKDEAIHSSRESLNGSDDSGSGSAESSGPTDDMTSAERFAAANQCTLKKNERYSGNAGNMNMESSEQKKEIKLDFKGSSSSSGSHEKPKAEVRPQENNTLKELSKDAETSAKIERISLNKPVDDILFIDENTTVASGSSLAVTTNTTTAPSEQNKSPIPLRNTQKFVSKFADLHLTGGCLSTSMTGTTAAGNADAVSGNNTAQATASTQQQVLTSFKPQVKVKPQILRKPLVLPPTTPEMVRRSQE